jgi:hypothetical protein
MIAFLKPNGDRVPLEFSAKLHPAFPRRCEKMALSKWPAVPTTDGWDCPTVYKADLGGSMGL